MKSPMKFKARARGGAAKHDDTAADTALVKKLVKPGAMKSHEIEGRAAGGRLDRAPRKGKQQPTVNITIANVKPDVPPAPPMMGAGPMPPTMPMSKAPMPMPMPQDGPPMPPSEPPVPMHKNGGGVPRAKGGGLPMTNDHAGGGSGEGRLEKIGKKA